MISIGQKLRKIRDVVAADWQYPNDASPLPPRNPKFEARLERALNMAIGGGTNAFDSGMKKAIDKALFRLKYDWFFRWERRFYEAIEHGAGTIKVWAGRKLR